MQLINEIIELAVDDKASLSAVLRKCLVLAHRLKNDRLKAWAEKELDGYRTSDTLPDYRETRTISKGVFFGPLGSKIENQPIPTAMLKEEHQVIVERAEFRSPIAAYELEPEERRPPGQWIIPWSPNLVAVYQKAFYQGDYALASAWQEVPGPFVASLVATVRNRILKFALEIQEELGSVGDDPAALPSERIDQTVINNIFGGNNVIAARVLDVTQAESLVVIRGDLASLTNALEHFGANKEDIQALEEAIAQDATTPPTSLNLGQRTLAWIKGAAAKLASRGGDVGLDVAKAEMTAELTKLVSRFLGLT